MRLFHLLQKSLYAKMLVMELRQNHKIFLMQKKEDLKVDYWINRKVLLSGGVGTIEKLMMLDIYQTFHQGKWLHH